MPFSWFSRHEETAASGGAADTRTTPTHKKTLSLSLSSSANQRARLEECRAKTKASYLAQSGDKLSVSGSRGSTHHSRHSSGGSRQNNSIHARRHQPIVAVEPDNDDSRHRRIDQGLLDACREAQMAQRANAVPKNKSWWSSAFSYESAVVTPTATLHPATVSSDSTNATGKNNMPNIASTGLAATGQTGDQAQHKPSISYTQTFRVP